MPASSGKYTMSEAADARLKVVSPFQNGEAIFRQVPPIFLHRILSKLPSALRFQIWRRLAGQFYNPQSLLRQRRDAEDGCRDARDAGLIQCDLDLFGAGFADRLIDGRAATMAVLPDLRTPDRGVLPLHAPQAFWDAIGRPMVLLGSHFGWSDAALLRLAATLPGLNITIAAPSRSVIEAYLSIIAKLEPVYGLGGIASRFQLIEVPSAQSALHCIQALRRNEAVYLAIDTDFGVQSDAQCVEFLGQQTAVPVSIYKMARQIEAQIFAIEIEVADGSQRMEIVPLAVPEEARTLAFHADALRTLEKRILRAPEHWTLWKYWRASKRTSESAG